jgi:hypothetical protein
MMKIKEFVNGIAVPVVTAVTGILVLSLDRSVKTFDAQLKLREAERLDIVEQRQTLQQQMDVRFRIYDAVTHSLESADARKQRVATALVLAMLEADDSLRLGLLEILRSEAAPEIKTQATDALTEASRFAAQQQTVPLGAVPSAGDWRSYNLDIFWCTSNGASARDTTARLQKALQEAGATGRIRVRELAPSINSSPGYRIAGLVIRREAAEESAAQAIKQIADPSVASTGAQFVLTASRQGTPGYLSLFVCQ